MPAWHLTRVFPKLGGLVWVNFQFAFVEDFLQTCDEELEVDMLATLISSWSILLVTSVLRYIVSNFAAPWYIRLQVRTCLSNCVFVCVCAYKHTTRVYTNANTSSVHFLDLRTSAQDVITRIFIC